jgi:SAM-dependent methyltransferase
MGWHDWTSRLYWRIQPVVVPELRNSQHAYGDRLKRALVGARRWLDLGCGHDFLPPWMDAEERHLPLNGCRAIGIDADADALRRHSGLTDRLHGDIEALPFRDGVFDLVTANMVIEHVARPAPLFHEVRRILAPGGRFIVHTPNAGGYSTVLTRLIPAGLRPRMAGALLGRDHRDVYPTFYRANTAATLHDLAREASLQVAEMTYIESSPQLIAVPPLLLGELALARLLRATAFERFRPCLLAVFEKDRI